MTSNISFVICTQIFNAIFSPEAIQSLSKIFRYSHIGQARSEESIYEKNLDFPQSYPSFLKIKPYKSSDHRIYVANHT